MKIPDKTLRTLVFTWIRQESLFIIWFGTIFSLGKLNPYFPLLSFLPCFHSFQQRFCSVCFPEQCYVLFQNSHPLISSSLVPPWHPATSLCCPLQKTVVCNSTQCFMFYSGCRSSGSQVRRWHDRPKSECFSKLAKPVRRQNLCSTEKLRRAEGWSEIPI